MIYLILKIFGYLFVALATGFASGWLFRNLVAAKSEEEMQSSLNDTRSKLPQFESLLRGRDQQITVLKDDLEKKEKTIVELMDESRATEKDLRKKTQELKRLSKQGGADDGDLLADADIGSDDCDPADAESVLQVVELKAQIVRLEEELEHLAESARVAGTDPNSHASDADRKGHLVQELEARVRQQAHEFERLGKTLEQEQRKVLELERERELQHKSLQVLHQQLDLERSQDGHHANG